MWTVNKYMLFAILVTSFILWLDFIGGGGNDNIAIQLISAELIKTCFSNAETRNMLSRFIYQVLLLLESLVPFFATTLIMCAFHYIDVKVMKLFCLFQEVTDKCFKKCISKPGTSLDNYQKVWV